jgi:hypothetical protein
VSLPVLLRVAPLVTARELLEPERGRRVMFQGSALTPYPGRDVPVVIDHDDANVVGHVKEFATFPDSNGWSWIFASCDVTEPPAWLRRNGGVSLSYRVLRDQDMGTWQRVLRALVDEVSLLSPSVQPAEPLARVAWIGEERSEARAVEHRDPRGQLLRRPNSGYVIGVR